MSKLYSVKKFVLDWKGGTDIAKQILVTLNEDLSWKEAKKIRSKNKNSEIFPQQKAKDTFVVLGDSNEIRN